MPAPNPLDRYDQLKRKNRRRLVGAVLMVVVAGSLLLSVLNQPESTATDYQQVEVTGLPQAASATPASDAGHTPALTASQPADADLAAMDTVVAATPASADAAAASETRPVVVKPATPAPQTATTTKPATTVTTEVKPPLTSRPATETTTVDKPAAVKPATPPATAEKPAANKPATTTAKPSTEKPATATAKPANNKPATAANNKPANTATNRNQRLTPQEILNNQAANQVTGSGNNRAQAILDGKTSNRALIQVGAYTDEAQAKTVQQKLAAAGVSASITQSETSKGTLYRVRTQTYASRAQAEQNLSRIRSQGLDGMVIGQ